MAEYRNRGDGKWQVVLSNGYTPSGKHKRVYRTITVDPEKTENAQRRAVEREAAKLQADFDRHVLTEAKKIRLSAVIDEYLENHPMADSTKAWYKGLFERIRPALGKIYVQDLTARQIREFYKELSGTDAKPARSGKKTRIQCSQLRSSRPSASA